MQTADDEVFRVPCLHKENANLGCGALFLSYIYREQMPVGFETDARNLNDVSSHIRQRTSTNLDLRAFHVEQNLPCSLNEFFDYESILCMYYSLLRTLLTY